MESTYLLVRWVSAASGQVARIVYSHRPVFGKGGERGGRRGGREREGKLEKSRGGGFVWWID